MKTEKNKTQNISAAFAFFLLIAAVAYGEPSSPFDFKQETPMTKLPIPVDFSEMVYAEVSKSVDVRFGSLWRLVCSVEVNTKDNKLSYKIKCNFGQKIASVICDHIDQDGHPKEEYLDSYKITNSITEPNMQNVCLMQINSTGGIDVIAMNAEIGSFTETICAVPKPGGLPYYPVTTIWYGTCRN